MATQMTGSLATGTLIDGILRLDERVDIPNNSRVSLQIEVIAEARILSADAWEKLKQRIKQSQIHSGGQRFSRDELHERR